MAGELKAPVAKRLAGVLWSAAEAATEVVVCLDGLSQADRDAAQALVPAVEPSLGAVCMFFAERADEVERKATA
jgi:hypothetical protein